jgi:hypothetical protein
LLALNQVVAKETKKLSYFMFATTKKDIHEFDSIDPRAFAVVVRTQFSPESKLKNISKKSKSMMDETV